MKKAIFMVIVVFAAYTATAEKLQSCAVLNFLAGPGVDSGQAGMLANRYSVLVVRSGLYSKVTPRHRVNETLIRAGFKRGSVSHLSAAVKAGKLLGVDHVIYGKVGKNLQATYLVTYLVDVKNAKQLKSVSTNSMKSTPEFLQTAPATNVKELLDIPDEPEPEQIIEPGPAIDPELELIESPIYEEVAESKPVPEPEPPAKSDDEKAVVKTVPEEALPKELKKEDEVPDNTEAASDEEESEDGVSLEEVSVNDTEIQQLTLPESDTDPELTPLHKWNWVNKVAIGTRFTHYSPRGDNEEYLGGIESLDAEQDYIPYKWFVEYMFNHRFGIELTWDKIQATAMTSGGYSDGDIILSGPIITGFARGNFDIKAGKTYKIHPYGGVGLAFMKGDFEHTEWWHNGFSATEWEDAEAAYDDWVSDGAEEWPNNGYQRTMTIDDSTGFVLTGGCSIEFTANWSLDLYLRYMKVSADNTFTLSNYGTAFRTTSATYNMDNIAYGLGVKYDF